MKLFKIVEFYGFSLVETLTKLPHIAYMSWTPQTSFNYRFNTTAVVISVSFDPKKHVLRRVKR